MTVDIYSNGNWTTLNKISGQRQTYQDTAWLQYVIDLTDYKGIIQLRLSGIRGNGAKGDMALDDISVFDSHKVDAALLSESMPAIFASTAGSTQNVQVNILNAGQTTIQNIYTGYIIGNAHLYWKDGAEIFKSINQLYILLSKHL